MVDFAPFRAIRYDENRAGSLSALIAPPYDVISAEHQSKLYEKHPNNIVRIDFTRAEAGDGELGKYDRAKKTLESWLTEGILKRDDRAALYILAQTFVGPDGQKRTRTGLFGRTRLVRFDEGSILPHERTLKGPKIDRLHLYRATRTNLSPIFGMYQDPKEEIKNVLAEATRSAPSFHAEMDGVENRVWVLSDEARIGRIRGLFEARKLYIADGHHRYETGLAYRDERRAAAGAAKSPEMPGYESILMFAAAVEDPGMVVFPTHRLVFGLSGLDEAQLGAKLDTYFARSKLKDEDPIDSLRRAGENTNAFLMVTRSGRQLLAARKDAPWDRVPALPAHPALRRLDVTLLHSVILEHILGISKEAQATQQNLKYSKDSKEALASLSNDSALQAAFLMNPTKVTEVIDVANAGEVMPQKSTFFYPKIPSGLVLYPLD